jgi:hypothetical protein
MAGTNCHLFTHKSSRSYLNHLVLYGYCNNCYVVFFNVHRSSNVEFRILRDYIFYLCMLTEFSYNDNTTVVCQLFPEIREMLITWHSFLKNFIHKCVEFASRQLLNLPFVPRLLLILLTTFWDLKWSKTRKRTKIISHLLRKSSVVKYVYRV